MDKKEPFLGSVRSLYSDAKRLEQLQKELTKTGSE
jgi:hypothetical protein